MNPEDVGLRVELTQDIQRHKKGERGVIGRKGGYLGVVFDNNLSALTISHAGMPITNFIKFVEEERLVQQSLFGDLH
jgi:hypothetical protein